MPIYEYRCDDCERSFETLVLSGYADDTECPHCHGRKLSRELSTFAARSATVKNGASAATGGGCSSGACCGGGCARR